MSSILADMILHRSHPTHLGVLPVSALTLALALALAGCGDDPQQAGPDQEAGQSPEGYTGEDADQQEDAGDDEGSTSGSEPFAEAQLSDPAGNDVGVVEFREAEEAVEVRAELHDLEPGFRGFHIHEVGLCEIQSTNEEGEFGDFLSAGGHLSGDAEEDLGVVDGEDAPETEGAEEEMQGQQPGQDGGAPEEVAHPDHAGDLPNILVVEDRTAEFTVVTDRLTPELLDEDEGSAVIVHSQADNHANIPERYAPGGVDADTLSTGDSGDRTACGVVESG